VGRGGPFSPGRVVLMVPEATKYLSGKVWLLLHAERSFRRENLEVRNF
jgi:hypothetical protein